MRRIEARMFTGTFPWSWLHGRPAGVDAVRVAGRLVAGEEVERLPVVRDLERAVVRPGDRPELAGDPAGSRRGRTGGDRERRPLREAPAGAGARAAVRDILVERVDRHPVRAGHDE